MSNEPTFDPRRKAAIRDLVIANAAAHPGRSGGRKRTALIVTLVLLAVSISGGTVAYALGTGLLDPAPIVAATVTATPTPTPTPTLTPTPTPTVAAPVQDPADPSTWVIGFQGVGPISLGAPLDEQESALPSFSDDTDPLCTAAYRWLNGATGVRIVLVKATDGTDATAAIVIGNSQFPDRPTSPSTAGGIGIGSTVQELQGAYPALQETGTYSDSMTYYGITDGHGAWIVFAVAHVPDEQLNGKVTAIQIANESVMPAENGSVKTMPSERCPA